MKIVYLSIDGHGTMAFHQSKSTKKSSTKAMKTPFKEPRTKWRNSKAKLKLYDDLVDGVIPLIISDEVEEPEEDIQAYWSLREEYKLYDPTKFKERIDSLRKTMAMTVRNCDRK